MKVFGFTLLFFSSFGYSQNISIEFSIEWQNELVYSIQQLEETDVKPVYLIVKYRNISDKSFYFSKITKGIFDLPDYFPSRSPISYDNIPFTHYQNDTCKPYFTVGLTPDPSYFSWFSWSPRKDSVCKEKFFYSSPCLLGVEDEETGDIVSYKSEPILKENIDDGLFMSLNGIYMDIYNRFYPENKDGKYNFYPEDITEHNILNDFRDKFVFLKPNETFVAKFNLIGFQIVGGNFNFQLDSTKSLNYVNVELPEPDFPKQYMKKELPLKVGEYELFIGDFVSNKTTVFFKGIKRKQ